jgi:hypothetical protein
VSPRAALLIVVVSSAAQAAPQRWALALGENRGLAEDAALSYAEDDARAVVEVLEELGDVDARHAMLVLGADADRARAALTALERRLAAEATPEDVLVVYLSSHADEGALHLGGTRLPLSELITFLDRAPVAVAVLVVDSCRSGALTRVKGLKATSTDKRGSPRPGPTHLASSGRTVDVVTGALAGRVIITSSGADEYAQESDLVKGSFFTHHLLGGLRGPADASGDGQVTLEEAYAWAYARTVESTFATEGGVQQPRVQVDLKGYGALVLTHPVKSSSRVVLDAEKPGEWLIASLEPNGGISLVEKPAGPAAVALPPGRYAVRLRTDEGYRERKIELAAATTVTVHGEEMSGGELVRVALKGPTVERRLSAVVGGALTNGMLEGLSFAAGIEVRLNLARVIPGVLGVAFAFRSSAADAFSQFEFEGRASWLWRWGTWRVTLGAGPELGLVLVYQDNVPDHSRRVGVEPLLGAAFEGRVRLVGGVSVVLGAGAGALVLKKESGTSPAFHLSGFLGLSFDLL